MAKDDAENATIITTEDYFNKYKPHYVEIAKDQLVKTNFPEPTWCYRIVYETYSSSIEEVYFWILNYLRYDMGFADIDKITDIFAAAETSAFGGVQQQRIGLQQDKVVQFLATVGKMIKDLFQLVRELRVLDERLVYYVDAESPNKDKAIPADITLKGIYIDMAEGGSKNPASVFGMARELQFTTLPDLFFNTFVTRDDEVNQIVDKLDFNESVKRVLKRKLYSFNRWKKETHKELKNRRSFTHKYLKQHFEIINMYVAWVKPYLKNIRRLQSDEKKVDTPDLIASFEGSMVEIELLAKHLPKGNKDVKGIIVAHFEYRTRPSMNYVAEQYQRGPLHVGETKMTLRTYAWTDEDIANYKKMRQLEDMELLTAIDSSIKAAMDALGDDLMRYLSVTEPKSEKKEEKKPKIPGLSSAAEPFTSVFKGFAEIFSAVKGGGEVKRARPSKANMLRIENERKSADKAARARMWVTYKNFKKGHKMIAW